MLSLFAQTHLRYGFMGLEGWLGVLLGFAAWGIVVWAVWKIFGVLAKRFGNENTNWLFEIGKIILIAIFSLQFIRMIFFGAPLPF